MTIRLFLSDKSSISSSLALIYFEPPLCDQFLANSTRRSVHFTGGFKAFRVASLVLSL